jgi:hypothetical protein
LSGNEQAVPGLVGVRSEFNCKQEVAITTFRTIADKSAPADMFSTIKATVETITSVVDAHLKSTKQQQIAIATDDLLPLLAFVLLRAQVPALPGIVKFLERFAKSYGLATEEGFHLVTLRAALTFLVSSLELPTSSAHDRGRTGAPRPKWSRGKDSRTGRSFGSGGGGSGAAATFHGLGLGSEGNTPLSRSRDNSPGPATSGGARTPGRTSETVRVAKGESGIRNSWAGTSSVSQVSVAKGGGNSGATSGTATPERDEFGRRKATATEDDMGDFLSKLAMGL